MGKIIVTIFLLMFVLPVCATENDEQLMDTGAWVRDWWENAYEIQIKKDMKGEEKITCKEYLVRYAKKLEEKPDSEYYQMKMDKWVKRCSKE